MLLPPLSYLKGKLYISGAYNSICEGGEALFVPFLTTLCPKRIEYILFSLLKTHFLKKYECLFQLCTLFDHMHTSI